MVQVVEEGRAGNIQLAHIIPSNGETDKKWEIYSYNDAGRIDLDLNSLISETESKLQKSYTELGGDPDLEGVLLVGFHTSYRSEDEKSVEELKSLAISAGKKVLGSVIQVRKEIDFYVSFIYRLFYQESVSICPQYL